MKKVYKFLSNLILIAMFTAILPQSSSLFAAGEGDSLFFGNQVHTVNISFTQPNYWDSLLYYYNQGLEQYMSATVTANGIIYNNVGVRLKGNSSFSHPNNKKSFRLSFNEFVSAQRWDGLKGVHLNNCWNDPTLMREKLYLDHCKRNGIAAPRGNYVRLSINDTLFAFYSLVEHVDKTFLSSRFGNNDGEQFKAVDAYGTVNDIISDFRWYGNDSSAYLDHYELKSDLTADTWRRLISLVDTLNHSNDLVTSLDAKVNLNNFYKAMATDNLFGNLDAYFYTGRNFYVYFPETTNKLEWVIWDAGLSFGGLPGGPASTETLPVTFVESDTGRPLFSKILNNPTLKNEYLLALCQLFNSSFSTSILFPKIDSIANLIRPFVYEDPRKMFTNAQFETNIISDLTISGSRKPGLKSFVSLRKSSVQSQLNNLGINCEIGINTNTNSVLNSFELSQNYPNPFNPSTQIDYSLNNSGIVTLKVYDNLGKEIASLVNQTFQNQGNYSVEWSGKDNSGAVVPTGMYFYKLIFSGSISGQDNTVTKKMILLK